MTASTPFDAGARDDHPSPAPAQPGTRRFDQRIRAGSSYLDRRFYLLPGACVAYRFRLTGTGAEEAAEDISRAIGFVSRDRLANQVRRYSGAGYGSTRSGRDDRRTGRRRSGRLTAPSVLGRPLCGAVG